MSSYGPISWRDRQRHMIWWQPDPQTAGSMLSAIIATHESERALVPTLAALVPGATAGLLGEVDRGRCRLARRHRRGGRHRRLPLHDLERAAGRAAEGGGAATRAPWLMFLRAGCVPEPGWIERRRALHRRRPTGSTTPARRRVPPAGRRRPAAAGPGGAARRCCASRSAAAPRPEQGLLIARRLLRRASAAIPHGDDAEAALLRRLGRRRTRHAAGRSALRAEILDLVN